ncbi:aminotransferase class IV [Ferruginibacter sp. SUN106]|uniref:aminotransferase class IV n=1 Tax=Ferruginibacter sp. SUN106 TaxID=2978348 RepID=UPI003D35AE63
MSWFNYNGKVYTENTPIIGAASRGLRYGDGLFETMKMKKGQLILDNEHFARLWKGMTVLQFAIPKHFAPEKLIAEVLQLAKKNGHEKAARVRITVFRGDGGLYDAADHTPNYIIETWALPDSNGELNSNGLDMGIYTAVKKSCDILSNLKTNNYLPYVMGALEAKKQKWNDAVVLNSFDRICDTTIANIFIIKNEMIYTPSLTEACVAGVFRKYIIDQIPATGFFCKEKEITIDELLDADEVFLTNSIYNIRWVKSIADKNFGNLITQKIYASFTPTIL